MYPYSNVLKNTGIDGGEIEIGKKREVGRGDVDKVKWW